MMTYSTQVPCFEAGQSFYSKKWRLNHLYTIFTKDNKKQILKFNDAQEKISSHSHPRKIVPKSRQQGVSTYAVAYNLDSCLTHEGYQAGIQSYGQDESDKLAKRALIMWNEMDPDAKTIFGVTLTASNKKEMVFSNGSILKIGNFRGDTLQSLHVSELAKISKRYPDKARELKTGAFQAVSAGNKITIESTSEGPHGLFYEMCMQAKALQDAGATLTPLDFELVFLSWVDDNDCSMEQEPHIVPHKKHIVTTLTQQYFPALEKKLNIVLTTAQKNWYIAKAVELGIDDIKLEYPATLEEAFEQSVDGTILKREYDSIHRDNRYGSFPHVPGVPVTVSYDIGVNDETILHFAQTINGRPRLIRTIAGSGEGLDYYADLIRHLVVTEGYRITDIILPHDANVTDFSTGRTRLERFRDHNLPVRLLKRTSLLDGIEALRQLVSVLYIDNSNTGKTLSAIQLYRWKYDKQLDVTIQIPLHDWCSNYMDSLRYMAQGLSYDTTVDVTYDSRPVNTYNSDYEGI